MIFLLGFFNIATFCGAIKMSIFKNKMKTNHKTLRQNKQTLTFKTEITAELDALMRKPTSSSQLAAFLFVDSRRHEPQDAVQCSAHGSTFELLFEFQTEFFSNFLFEHRTIYIYIYIYIYTHTRKATKKYHNSNVYSIKTAKDTYNFIVTQQRIYKIVFVKCFKNDISKAVAIISDTLLETISECLRDSVGHCRRNSGDFQANSVFEGLKVFRSVCAHLRFETAPQEEIAGSEIRRMRWPPDIAAKGDQLPRKHFPKNLHGSPRRMSRCSILLTPGIRHIHFFYFFQALKDAIRREIAAIPPAMTERVMRPFRNHLEEFIANDGHHLGDIIFKTR
jgi:hypothetical protein